MPALTRWTMDYNHISLIGHLGKDPEMRFTPDGSAVTNFQLAVGYSFKKDGQQQSKTVWFTVNAWRTRAEWANQFLSKGNYVFVEGRFDTRVWEDSSGVKQTQLVVHSNSIILLTPKAQAAKGSQQESSDEIEAEDLPF